MDINTVTQEAALAMKGNDFERALKLLKVSLGISRRNLSAMRDGHGDDNVVDACGMASVRAVTDADLTTVEACSVNNDFLLFDQLFVPTNQDSPARQSMACLFNLGLCYHLFAFCGRSGDCSTSLKKASHFYNMGINTTEQLVHNDGNLDSSVAILYLAFLNNGGHVASHLLDKEESRWHSQTILRTVLVVLPRRGVVDPVSTLLGSFIPSSTDSFSALSFFCPLRFYAEFNVPAPAA